MRLCLAALLLLTAAPAWATVWIAAGTYIVAVRVVPAKAGPYAVINEKTRSECHVMLKGPEAKKLKLRKPTDLQLRLQVAENATCRKDMDATLLEVMQLGDTKPSRILGNNFLPLKL